MFHDSAERTVAISIWISSYSAGAAIGPLVGGLLLEHFWWGSVFLVSVPVMVLLLALAPVLLPEFRDPEAGRLDLTSAGLSLAAVLPVIYGLKQIAVDGLSWPSVLFIAVGLAAGVGFIRRQKALSTPLIDLRLFRSPAFSAALAIYTLGTLVAFGVFVFIAQYLQLVLGLSPLRAGLWTVPFALAFVVGSMLTPAVARRMRPTSVVIAGLFVAAIGFIMLTQVDGAGLALLVTGFVVFSLGLAPVFTLATDIVIGNAPPERAGAAAALSETGSEFGGALGIAVLGSIGTAVYRGTLGQVAPPGTPPEAWEIARDTLGAALMVAERLPGDFGAALAASAREAFASSLQLTSAVAAAIVIVTAILAMLMFRREPARRVA
jgi:MFS transporter, DHA2 family, multidrug resistance protein